MMEKKFPQLYLMEVDGSFSLPITNNNSSIAITVKI
jgi:hypothetical protein